MSEEMELPKGWEEERLGDFVFYQKGKKPRNISNVQTAKCTLPYVNIKAFEKNVIDEYTDGIGCIPCSDNDFLMVWDGSRSGYVGKAITGVIGSTLVKIQFPGIYIEYAYLFLQSKYLQINTKAKGTGIPHVDPNLLWNYRFPIPPLAEQHRIVAKIEELFSSLDKGIESLKTAQAQLKTYRQAVLKWAFEGKLTNENVKDRELPKGWKIKNLGQLKEFSLYGPRFSSDDYSDNGIAVLRTSDISENGKVDWANAPKLNLTKQEYQKYKLIQGDLLITRTGSIGTISVFNDNKRAIAEAFLIYYRLRKPIDMWFIFYFLKSFKAQKHFKKFSSGVGRPNLNVPNIELLQIPIPSIDEQNSIVSEIEKRLSVCDKLEESITESLSQSEALRQSILKKAFEGKLVPQAPNDEPASVLLARIRAERAATVKESLTAGKKRKKL